MNYLLSVVFLTVFSFSGFAQDEALPKVKTDSLKVEGVCGMCKNRIEEAVNLSKGVKSCSWNEDTKMLSVTYKTKKTSIEEIAQALADAGHDNSLIKATDKEYSKIHKCCRYREMDSH
jgi:copper chaperone CopZ